MVLKTRFQTLLCLALATVAVGLATGIADASDLEQRIRRAVEKADLGGTVVTVSVRDVETDRPLAGIDEDRPMIPASNMKLFTSGAALHRFGPDHLARTELRFDGRRLWFVGGGDPALGDPVLLEETAWPVAVDDGDAVVHRGLDIDLFLDLMVDSIRGSGIDSIEELVVDDRIFDRVHFHPDWPVDQLDKTYCAEVAGVNLHLNVLRIHAHPGSGSRPEVRRTEPAAPWLDLTMTATRRTGRKDTTTIGVSRPAGRNQFRIYGNIGEPISVQVTLSDMPTIVGELLRHRLRKAGLEVGSVRLATAEDPVRPGRTIEPTYGTPISTLLTRCNTNSVNLYAEALCKLLGHDVEDDPGSWANGTRAVRMVVHERLGSEHASAFQPADGSGLSRKNRITADTTTAWLASLARDPELGPMYLESLAEVGATGTVRNRGAGLPQGVRVDCKTGYINGVSCLSGVVTGPEGRQRAFSVLCNEIPGGVPTRRAKNLQDEIVRLVAEDLPVRRTAIGSD